MKILDHSQVREQLQSFNSKRNYWAMYSSLFGGIVLDRELMVLPIDDHMVHRGDGVFEAVRVINGKMYLLDAHLERLMRSAEMVALSSPHSKDEIKNICEQLIKINNPMQNSMQKGATVKETMLRLFLSRGPGDFSPNPYSTIGTQIYIVLTGFKPLPEEQYLNGVKLMISKIPGKPSPFSQIKSCNYLPNVLMKKESVDQGFDFSIGLNEEGLIAEGPTENIFILNKKNELIAPRFDYTLRGTTLMRVMKLAEKLNLKNIRTDDVSVEDLYQAQEVMMVGTTLGVLPVRQIENQIISEKAGPVAQKLHQLLMLDMGHT